MPVSRRFSISLDFRSTSCYSSDVGTVIRTAHLWSAMRSLRKLLILLAAVAIGLPPARGECACQGKQDVLPCCRQSSCCEPEAVSSHSDCCGGEHPAPCNCPGCECHVKSASAAPIASVPQLVPVADFAATPLAVSLPSHVQANLNQALSIWRLARGPTLPASAQQLFCVWVI